MTKTDKRISLFDFCKKRADKVQIYGEERHLMKTEKLFHL